jgi:hypothetical protein
VFNPHPIDYHITIPRSWIKNYISFLNNSAKFIKFLTPDGSKQSAKMAARKLMKYLSGKEMRDWLTR